MKLSPKGQKLVALYETMATDGYNRTDGTRVVDAFEDFESRRLRNHLKIGITEYQVKSALDYGSGGSDWHAIGFDEIGQSAKDFYGLDVCLRYEPARAIDERKKVDCVLCFDVLEHIFIADLEAVVVDIFSHATKLVIINVACYPAAAVLPNGENAHVTVRPPHYWKALIDQIALRFPNVSVWLFTAESYNQPAEFPIYKANDWINSESFVTTT
jgi:hypothetical protein